MMDTLDKMPRSFRRLQEVGGWEVVDVDVAGASEDVVAMNPGWMFVDVVARKVAGVVLAAVAGAVGSSLLRRARVARSGRCDPDVREEVVSRGLEGEDGRSVVRRSTLWLPFWEVSGGEEAYAVIAAQRQWEACFIHFHRH